MNRILKRIQMQCKKKLHCASKNLNYFSGFCEVKGKQTDEVISGVGSSVYLRRFSLSAPTPLRQSCRNGLFVGHAAAKFLQGVLIRFPGVKFPDVLADHLVGFPFFKGHDDGISRASAASRECSFSFSSP
jgi:hypothetical protein